MVTFNVERKLVIVQKQVCRLRGLCPPMDQHVGTAHYNPVNRDICYWTVL